MVDAALAIVVLVLAVWTGLLMTFARPLLARWREPVFRHPVLVLESDDWGAGPLTQAEALSSILELLRQFKDAVGRHPVMTLGMIFEIPDTERMATNGAAQYHGRELDDDCFCEIRRVIQGGIREGIFVPQLHGASHYWPPAVMRSALASTKVAAWLTQAGLPRTERLPPPLQSRWVDASELPSRALAPGDVDRAVSAEAQMFCKHFGTAPHVAVPTTFVWNDAVESAWGRNGVEVVIAPGRRYTFWNVQGRPAGVDRAILTGQRSSAGQCYVVRDVYLEPALGHGPERLVRDLEIRTRQGRACLVEIHRFNFLDRADQSLAVLGDSLREGLSVRPEVRFMSPLELARAIRTGDARVLETALGARLRAWLARVGEIPRFARLMRATGLIVPLAMADRILQPCAFR